MNGYYFQIIFIKLSKQQRITAHNTQQIFINTGKLSSNQNIITEEFEKFILY